MEGNGGQDSHFCSRMCGKQMQNARWSVGEHTQVRWQIHAGAFVNTGRSVGMSHKVHVYFANYARVLYHLYTSRLSTTLEWFEGDAGHTIPRKALWLVPFPVFSYFFSLLSFCRIIFFAKFAYH